MRDGRGARAKLLWPTLTHTFILEKPAAWGCVAVIPILIPLYHWSFSCMAYSWLLVNFNQATRCHIPQDIFIVTAMRTSVSQWAIMCAACITGESNGERMSNIHFLRIPINIEVRFLRVVATLLVLIRRPVNRYHTDMWWGDGRWVQPFHC
jgi:hypothetical protein